MCCLVTCCYFVMAKATVELLLIIAWLVICSLRLEYRLELPANLVEGISRLFPKPGSSAEEFDTRC